MPYADPDKPISKQQAQEMLRLAHVAAKEREPMRMLELLAASQFLDGQVNRVARIYRRSGLHAAEDVVSIAVGQLYERLADPTKKLVEKPDAFLTKAVLGIAKDELDKRIKDRDAVADRHLIHHDHADEASRDILRAEAIRVARTLVSRLGQVNVRRVMDIVLDAVEDMQPISRQEIAEALDLKPNTVSKCIERGFTRLARVAEEEGYTLTLDHALAIEDGILENDDEDEEDRDDDPLDEED